MKTEYKYFYFELVRPIDLKKKTQTWFCISKNDKYMLGVVKWFPNWRQYCFFPEDETVFSIGCLNDMIDFTKQLNEGHRKQISKERMREVVDNQTLMKANKRRK